MSQLRTIFGEQNQKLAARERSAADQEELVTLLSFMIQDSVFAVPLHCVREIVEGVQITLLPVPCDPYIAVLNLRGTLVPILAQIVVNPRVKEDVLGEQKQRRYVIFETESKQPFALEGTRFRRLEFEPSRIPGGVQPFLTVIANAGEPIQLINYHGPEGCALLASMPRGPHS
ncbi:chemotaxis protein CheW [Bdellovibrionota bacterium FG-1]